MPDNNEMQIDLAAARFALKKIADAYEKMPSQAAIGQGYRLLMEAIVPKPVVKTVQPAPAPTPLPKATPISFAEEDPRRRLARFVASTQINCLREGSFTAHQAVQDIENRGFTWLLPLNEDDAQDDFSFWCAEVECALYTNVGSDISFGNIRIHLMSGGDDTDHAETYWSLYESR